MSFIPIFGMIMDVTISYLIWYEFHTFNFTVYVYGTHSEYEEIIFCPLLDHFSTGWSYTDGNRVEFSHL